MGGLDPLRIPAAFWRREDVDRALDQRDVGGLFRLLRQFAGASQRRIGTACDLQQGTVSRIVNGERLISSIDVLERIADGLAIPDDSRMRLGLAPKGDPLRRRTALGLGLAAASPATLAELLHGSAAEAMEFTRQRAASSVGAGTLEHLTAAIAELDRVFEWQPAAKLFPVARGYRHRVAELLDGRHTFAEARELYAHAAHLSYLLGDLAHDLGAYAAARAYAIDSYNHADQAGHAELGGWASSSLSAMLLLAGHTAKAVDAAERGIAKAPETSAIGARLRARAARAHARHGNRAACAQRLREAHDLCDRLPDASPSRLASEERAFTVGKIAEHAAYCQVWLGDYTEAERHARAALGLATYSPGAAGTARIDLAMALAHLGSPDEAVEHATQALTNPRDLGWKLPRARELSTTLTNRYPGEPSVKDFNERYRQLATQALVN